LEQKMKRELLIGCGRNLKKRVAVDSEEWEGLVTLDINGDHKPDILWDLERLPYSFAESNEYNEIHAYEVLEHTGRQGDWNFFFRQWAEFWRILKPGGFVVGTSPALKSAWLWGDPGHTRAVTFESFVFLSQEEYKKQVGITAMSDYRWFYRADFELVHKDIQGESIVFALQAIKPSRFENGTA
jgi:hypothetical protein